jgi:hypothetical protein
MELFDMNVIAFLRSSWQEILFLCVALFFGYLVLRSLYH